MVAVPLTLLKFLPPPPYSFEHLDSRKQSEKVSGAERRLLVVENCPHTVLGYRTFVGERSKKTGRLDERYLDSGAVQRKKESGKGYQRPAGRERGDVESQEKVWEEVEELLMGWQTGVGGGGC